MTCARALYTTDQSDSLWLYLGLVLYTVPSGVLTFLMDRRSAVFSKIRLIWFPGCLASPKSDQERQHASATRVFTHSLWCSNLFQAFFRHQQTRTNSKSPSPAYCLHSVGRILVDCTSVVCPVSLKTDRATGRAYRCLHPNP